MGGNLALLKWLVEERRCPLETICRSGDDQQQVRSPLRSSTQHTVLAIAAMRAHSDMIRYLVLEKKCRIDEITELSMCQRAMCAILQVCSFYLFIRLFDLL